MRIIRFWEITASLFLYLPVIAFSQQENYRLETIKKQTIEAHLSFLASDALEGRQTGKNGGRVAAEYIQTILKIAGVKPFYDSYFQCFEAYSPARERNAEFQVHPDSISKYKQLSAYRRLGLQNVIGYIEGERKTEYIVIGAHYDHLGIDDLLVGDQIYNGADDNASSVAALLQVATSLAGNKKKPLRSIIIAFWDGEEVNYLGSEYFVENFVNTAAIKTSINLDMISRDGLLPILYPEFKIPEATEENTVKANQFHLLFTEELANINQQVQTQINENKLDIVPKPSILQHNSSGSDHQAFSFRNIPVLWFFTGLHPYYHTPEDEIENINLDKLTEITKAIYLITTHLANQKE